MAQTNNILIGSPGVASQTNTIMIGDSTTSACYVAGIYGNSIGTSNNPVVIDSTNKLGTLGGTSSGEFGTKSFQYFLGANVPNVTGDGTNYYLGSTAVLTQIFDNTSGNFYVGSGAGTGTANAAYFQAPATGTYYFMYKIYLLIGAPSSVLDSFLFFRVETPSRNYESLYTASIAGNFNIGNESLNLSCQANLTLNDKTYFSYEIQRATSSKVDGLQGSGSPYVTFISGYRIT